MVGCCTKKKSEYKISFRNTTPLTCSCPHLYTQDMLLFALEYHGQLWEQLLGNHLGNCKHFIYQRLLFPFLLWLYRKRYSKFILLVDKSSIFKVNRHFTWLKKPSLKWFWAWEKKRCSRNEYKSNFRAYESNFTLIVPDSTASKEREMKFPSGPFSNFRVFFSNTDAGLGGEDTLHCTSFPLKQCVHLLMHY